MKNTTHQNLNNYYFTFGSDIEYPYQDTYLIIKSDNYYNARGIFPKIYPSRDVSGALHLTIHLLNIGMQNLKHLIHLDLDKF